MKPRLDVTAVIENQSRTVFQGALITLISITAFLEGLDAQLQGYTAPTLIKLWHISRSGFSPVFMFFQFGIMLGAIVVGNLGDIFGRRIMIMNGVLFFGIFTVAGAYATNVSMLAATRFLSAVFLGGAIANAIALIIDYSPKGRRAFRVGVMYAIYGIGSSAGGFLAARAVPHFGWQSMYYLCGIMSVAFSIVLYFFLPESVRFMALRHRYRDMLVSTLHKLAPDIHIQPATEFYVPNDIGRKSSVIELFKENRMLMTISLWSAYSINMIALIFVTSWMPVVFADSGISYSTSVIATSLFQGGGAIGALVGGWVLDRKNGILGLCGICISAVPVIVWLGQASNMIPMLMALACVAGLCIVSTNTGLNALGGLLYPTTLRATGAGWANGIGRIGAIAGPLLGGILVSVNLPLPIIFLIVAIPSLCVSTLLLLLNFSRPNTADLSTTNLSRVSRAQT